MVAAFAQSPLARALAAEFSFRRSEVASSCLIALIEKK